MVCSKPRDGSRWGHCVHDLHDLNTEVTSEMFHHFAELTCLKTG
jgi:hypothetical protein